MSVSVYRVPLNLFKSLALGLVGYDNDHFMPERTKFNKLYRKIVQDFKRHCILFTFKEYVSSLRNNFVF